MTHTRQEIKAAIEWCLYVCKEIDDSNSGAAAKLSSTDVTTVLRAMLETFDAKEDFYEAAKNHSEIATHPQILEDDVAAWYDRSEKEQHAAYRRLVEKEGK